MAERTLLQNIKHLQERTGLSMQTCKKALDESGNEVNRAIQWLTDNQLIRNLSYADILAECASHAPEWATDFLDTVSETGELKIYHESGRVGVIQDNFFSWYVVGIPGKCPFLFYQEHLKFFTDDEQDGFSEAVKKLYDEVVEQLLPEYIRRNILRNIFKLS